MYLLDTNILLELLLDQPKADEAELLINARYRTDLSLTDFAFHSVGLALIRQRLPELLVDICEDLFDRGGIRLRSLLPDDISALVAASERFGLDFDDAYQYTVAERDDLEIVSFDKDFDRTERGRLTPADVLARIDT